MIILDDFDDPRLLAFLKACRDGRSDGYEGRKPNVPTDDPDLADAYIKHYGEGHKDAAFIRVQRTRLRRK